MFFQKYQGTGNDFIMINGFNFTQNVPLTEAQIRFLCDRKFGIGADGLIIIKPSDHHDFEMEYFNADGHLGSMCGNGGRCAFQFALDLGIVNSEATFLAYDGQHEAHQEQDWIALKMIDVNEFIQKGENTFEVFTGSPHFVRFVDHVLDEDEVVLEGRKIRYSDTYLAEGINVNFATIVNGDLNVLTYERGVEDLTLACGTGVTAAALLAMRFKSFPSEVRIKTLGGELKVRAQSQENGKFTDVWLIGPAAKVFEGTILL